MNRTSSTLSFRRDMTSGVPVYRQIIDQILGGIAAGSLEPGAQLPTVRQLAVDLAINPNTVVRAYRELDERERRPNFRRAWHLEEGRWNGRERSTGLLDTIVEYAPCDEVHD